jgi:hypothetical protein
MYPDLEGAIKTTEAECAEHSHAREDEGKKKKKKAGTRASREDEARLLRAIMCL